MSLDIIDKRNFYLTLSVVEGQHLAHFAGFAVPSEEVQVQEVMDTVKKWIILSGSGVTPVINKCVDWMMEIVDHDDHLTEEAVAHTREVLGSYSVALLSHLIDNHIIDISPDVPFVPEAVTFVSNVMLEEDDDDDE